MTRASTAHRLTRDGTALLRQGDFHNARQLLNAVRHRVDGPPGGVAETFLQHRRARAHRAQVLGRILACLEADHSLALRRAPGCAAGVYRGLRTVVRSAGRLAPRTARRARGAPVRRARGAVVPALGARVHPHYGVFSPVRGEYVDLVARTPLPWARRGVRPRHGYGRARRRTGPPRVRARGGDRRQPASPGVREGQRRQTAPHRPRHRRRPVPVPCRSRRRRRLQPAVAARRPDVLSDLAEHLGLRTRDDLLAAFASAGLRVAGRLDTRPRHPRARDSTDPLHRARAAEVASLWRLTPAA